MIHKSVLLQSAILGLNIKKGDIFVDGTLGNGGHTFSVCESFGKEVKIIGIDMDYDALDRSKERLASKNCDITLVQGNFRNIDEIVKNAGVEKVDKILLDIGLSSNQFEESGRGFSFQKDEPLLMTFKKNPNQSDITAFEIVNKWDEENIEAILSGYGEEKFSKRIARAIVEERENKEIKTTGELVEIIKKATPIFYHKKKIHPATKTFQALRITVNDELGALKEGLEKSLNILNKEGRLVVISFHSLEDRIVKNFFKEKAKNEEFSVITKKPTIPDEKEIEENPRSRSAKMRIIQKNK